MIILDDNMIFPNKSAGAAEKWVSGGQFSKKGWASVEASNQIVVVLERPFEPNQSGAVQIEIQGFSPRMQYEPASDGVISEGGYRYHFFGIGSQYENHWQKGSCFALLRGGQRYGTGYKFMYGSLGSPRDKSHGAEIEMFRNKEWDAKASHIHRIEWTDKTIRYILDDKTVYEKENFGDRKEALKYVWIGRDNFRGKSWPSLIGPTFLNLKVFAE